MVPPLRAEEKQEPTPTLHFKGKLVDPASWLEPAGGKLQFRASSHDQTMPFVPLSSIVHERYSLYHKIKEQFLMRRALTLVLFTGACKRIARASGGTGF